MIDIGSVLKAARKIRISRSASSQSALAWTKANLRASRGAGAVVSDDELERWLAVLCPADATRVRCWLQTPWAALDEPQPPWNHSDILALAEAASCGLPSQGQRDGIPRALCPQLTKCLAKSGPRRLHFEV